jgi:NADPH-dependent 2,4-dienoyl-CoA reductase/sulfur reductase-like enzyme
MEAARVAVLRGHDVTLFEKENKLGGQLIPASVPSFKHPVKEQIRYLENQINKLGVKVKLGRKATPALIKRLKPDAVILATGASHLVPDIPGVERQNVATASEILLGKKKAGERVAIIGGGDVGCELAWFLAEQGRKATIIEMQYAVASGMNLFSRFYLLNKLTELGVETAVGTMAEKITDKGVVVIDMDGNKKVIETDTVVLAVGFKSNNGLAEELKGAVPELYTIGDCAKLGKIKGAIHSGARAGHRI